MNLTCTTILLQNQQNIITTTKQEQQQRQPTMLLQHRGKSIEKYPFFNQNSKSFDLQPKSAGGLTHSYHNNNYNGNKPFNNLNAYNPQTHNNNYYNDTANNIVILDKRCPEIQMINKLYGLVPKKFIMHERICSRPDTGKFSLPTATLRSRTRSASTKSMLNKLSINNRTFSLDSSSNPNNNEDNDKNGTTSAGASGSSSTTPLVAKRISFEKSYFKQLQNPSRNNMFKPIPLNPISSSHAGTTSNSTDVNNKSTRVIHIDLNRMRWTDNNSDVNANDETNIDDPTSGKKKCNTKTTTNNEIVVQKKQEEQLPTSSKTSALSKKNNFKARKTISFDESTLRENDITLEVIGDENGKQINNKVQNVKNKDKRPSTAAARTSAGATNESLNVVKAVKDVQNSGENKNSNHNSSMDVINANTNNANNSNNNNSPLVHWTAGKTTAERRAKLQKSFSIHPSSIDISQNPFSMSAGSFDSNLGFGIESENDASTISNIYPDSMKRVGKRSLHVESPHDDIDTLLSSASTNNARNKSYSSFDDIHYNTYSVLNNNINPAVNNLSRSISSNNIINHPSTSTNYTHNSQSAQLSNIASNDSKQRQKEINSKIEFGNNPSYTNSIGESSQQRRNTLNKSMSLPESATTTNNSTAKINTTFDNKNNRKIYSGTSTRSSTTSTNNNTTSKKPGTQLLRSTSLQKCYYKNSSNNNDGSSSTKNKISNNNNNNKIIIKKPIIMETTTKSKLRPKTAPINHSKKKMEFTKSKDDNKRNVTTTSSTNIGDNNNSNNRRQPMKAKLQFPTPNLSRHDSKEGQSHSGGAGVEEKNSTRQSQGSPVSKFIKKVGGGDDCIESESSKGVGVTDVEMKKVSWDKTTTDPPKEDEESKSYTAPSISRKHSFKTLKNLPSYLKLLQQPRRRSLSMDDESLLKFSISNQQQLNNNDLRELQQNNQQSNNVMDDNKQDEGNLIGVVESSSSSSSLMPNSIVKNLKKQEECLKIYNKMMKVGCNVKLQTIFRGMMSPVEYREFITAAATNAQKTQEIDESQRETDVNCFKPTSASEEIPN